MHFLASIHFIGSGLISNESSTKANSLTKSEQIILSANDLLSFFLRIIILFSRTTEKRPITTTNTLSSVVNRNALCHFFGSTFNQINNNVTAAFKETMVLLQFQKFTRKTLLAQSIALCSAVVFKINGTNTH